MKVKSMELKLDPIDHSEYPVLVKEILSENSADVCVSLSEDGYSWIIHRVAHTMIVWNRRQLNSTGYPIAHTLPLAPTGLKYSADNVCFYNTGDRELPGVLAVNPEGTLRHFVQLDRKPFESLIDIKNDIVVGVHALNTRKGIEFLVSTSRNGFYLLKQSSQRLSSNGAVIVKELRPKEYQRRFSMFMSSSSPDDREDVRRSTVLFNSRTVDLSEKVVATISAKSLKISSLADMNSISKLDVSVVASMFFDMIGRKKIVTESQRKNVKVAIVDVCEYRGGVLVLSMCHNMEDRTYYALGFLTDVSEKELSFDWFYELRIAGDILRKHAITSKDMQEMHLIFNESADEAASEGSVTGEQQKDIVLLSSNFVSLAIKLLGKGGRIIEVHDSHVLRLPEGSLGIANLNGLCYVFLRDSGFAVLRLVPWKFDVSFDRSSTITWIKELFGKELRDPKLPKHLLANAFVSFCSKKFNECERYSNQMNFLRSSDFVDIATSFVLTVMDGTLPNDAHWEISSESQKAGEFVGKKSLQLMRLLESKKQFFDMFICFIKYVGTYDKFALTTKTYASMPMTRARTALSYLVELGEKLCMLLVLYEWVSETNVRLFDKAVKILMKSKGDHASNHHSTLYDHFFRKVSAACGLFDVLFSLELNELKDSEEISDRFRVIFETGGIVQKVMDAITTYRCSPGAIEIDVDNRWTSMSVIISAFERHLSHISDLLEKDCRGLVDQYALLCDHAFLVSQFILGQQSRDQLNESPIIERFLKLSEREKATKLAEDFEDFSILIRETLKDENKEEKLSTYKQRFASSNFTIVLMKYYLKHKMISELLKESGPEAEDFVLKTDAVSWTRLTHTGDYAAASSVLKKLAEKNTRFPQKRKMALVLGRLNALCADTVSREEMDLLL